MAGHASVGLKEMRRSRRNTVKQLQREDEAGDLLSRTSPGKLAQATLVFELGGDAGVAVLKNIVSSGLGIRTTRT